jgi:hypothetical protein
MSHFLGSMDSEKIMGDRRGKEIPCFLQEGAFWREGDELQVVTERLYRGNVFLFFGATEGCQRDKMVFGKVFEPVVDYDRSSDNL